MYKMINNISYLHEPDFQIRVQNEIKAHHLKEVPENRKNVTPPVRKLDVQVYNPCLSQEKPLSFNGVFWPSGIY